MKCWQCDNEAEGVCRFCGRAVCRNEVQTMPFILTIFVGKESIPKVISVADVLWCGVCKPQPAPIPMPEIF